MRGKAAAIFGAYLLATGDCAASPTPRSLQAQCPATDLSLSTVMSCTQGGDVSDVLQAIQLSSTWARPALSEHKYANTPWISPDTGLVYTNNKPACTPDLDYLNDTLCVYVHPTFHNNRGLAIFTTPTLATEFTQRIHTISASHSTNPILSLNAPPGEHYIITPLPSRGLGATTLHPLTPTTLLTYTTPILIVHSDNNPTTFDRETYLRLAISLLPRTTREQFHTLARIYHNPSISHQDIVKANTFAVDIAGSQHLALFPEPSRFNHDCAPNAMYHVDSLGLTHTVHTTRRLAEGEEVTISYLDPFAPGEARRAYLKEAFGFECSCRRCADADGDDKRLVEIKRLEGLLGNWEARGEGEGEGLEGGLQWYDYADLAEELIAIYQELGLQGFMNTAYGHAALAYNSVGESGRATMYARRALEVARLRHGWSGSRAVGVWEEFLAEGAWKHWSWRRRMVGVE